MGAGLAMGQQMANSMQGSTASAAHPPPLQAAIEYHVALNGQATGPFSLMVLRQQLAKGELQKDTLVWAAGMEDWAEASRVPELAEMFVSKAPPPLPAS